MLAPIREVRVKKLLDKRTSPGILKCRIVEVVWDQHPYGAAQAPCGAIHAAADAVVGRAALCEEVLYDEVEDLLGGW
jgi:hypothetical protein